jgi:hypothetical protein
MVVIIITLGGIMVVSGLMLPFLIDELKAFSRARNTGEKVLAVSRATAWAGGTILLDTAVYLVAKAINTMLMVISEVGL